MRFPILNLQTIPLPNSKYEKVKKKFECFQEETIKILLNANQLYEKNSNLISGLSGKSMEQHRDDLKCGIEKYDASKFHQFANICQKDILKIRMHEWYIEENKRLNNRSFWNTLKDCCIDNQQLEKLMELEIIWQSHAIFSYYSSAALLNIVRNILPVFENYLSLLELEYQVYGEKLPKSLKKEVANYKKKLAFEIHQERQRVCQAMLIRLSVACSNNDIYFDDVTIDLAQQLLNMGLINTNFTLPSSQRRELTSVIRENFQSYIQKNGTRKQQNVMADLSWNRSDKNYSVIRRKEGLIVFPKTLEKNFKSKSLISKILRIGMSNRNFVEKRAELITELRFPSNPLQDFQSLAKFFPNDKWSVLVNLCQKAAEENRLAESLKPANFLSKIIHKEKRDFIIGWQQYLLTQQKLLLGRIRNYVKLITEQLRTRLELSLDHKLLCSTLFVKHLADFKLSLLASFQSCGISPEQVSEYCEFNKIYQQVIVLKNRIEKMQHPNDQLNTKLVDEVVKESKTIFMEQLDALLCKIILPNNVLKYKQADFQELVACIEDSLMKAGIEMNISEKSTEYVVIIVKLINAYLHTWIGVIELEKESVGRSLEQLEKILKKISPVYLREKIVELIDLREKDNWFVFQAKCHAVIVGLGSVDDSAHVHQLEKKLPQVTELCQKPKVKCQTDSTSSHLFFNKINIQQDTRKPSQNDISQSNLCKEVK